MCGCPEGFVLLLLFAMLPEHQPQSLVVTVCCSIAGAVCDVFAGRFDGELCAIKTSRPCSGDENNAHEVFAREAEILRSCSHR